MDALICGPNSKCGSSESKLCSFVHSVFIRDLIAAAMISILAQERLLGAALGSVFAGVVIFEQRRDIYKTIAQNQPHKSQMKEPISRKKFEFAHYWNKSVDRIFRPAIQAVSSRRS